LHTIHITATFTIFGYINYTFFAIYSPKKGKSLVKKQTSFEIYFPLIFLKRSCMIHLLDGCGISSPQPDQYTVNANFNGDDYYKPSQSASQTLYVYQPTNFVIWGGNKLNLADINVGQVYTFWEAKWADQVKAGNFIENPSFKGYADQSNGSRWTSNPGNSSNPPASIANYIGVIVTTNATKTGNTLSGNVAELVILKVDNPSSYQPNPGHPASGTMVSVIK
jgi:hypothetical protein